jgi:Rhodopsin-like GPCR transmembrane domain
MSNGDVSELYEDGKHRRYSLLFAVNGGAFAIAKYSAGDLEEAARVMVGGLTIERLSLGMALFSIVMVWDIYAFGSRMHKINSNLFRVPGRVVFCLIGLLICVGWLIAGSYMATDSGRLTLAEGAVGVLVVIVVTWAIHEIPEFGRQRFIRSLTGSLNTEDSLQNDKIKITPAA